MTNNPVASRNGDVRGASVFLPTSENSESMPELRHEVTELARTLPGDLRRLRVRGGDREIEVEWAEKVETPDLALERRTPAAPGGSGQVVGADSEPAAEDAYTSVRAPLVGCYFAAPSPDAEPFVRVGDEVEAGTTVAIIEAMKMMNQITAGESGIVTEVLVANGESVEYDQVLLRLRPREQAA